jgi:hypothetical protein
MYREMGPLEMRQWLGDIRADMMMDEPYMSNVPELALGQGGNKGFVVELDTSGLHGRVNTQKPVWQALYEQNQAEFVGRINSQEAYRNSVRSVTVKPDAQGNKSDIYRIKEKLKSWPSTVNADGSVTYTNPAKQNPVSRFLADESGALKLGQWQRPDPHDFEGLLQHQADLEDRIGEINERLYQLETKAQMAKEGSGIVRPPNAFVGWTDEEVLEFAEREGLNPYVDDWWVDQGLVARKDMQKQIGKRRKVVMQRIEKVERSNLIAERKELAKEKKLTEAQLNAHMEGKPIPMGGTSRLPDVGGVVMPQPTSAVPSTVPTAPRSVEVSSPAVLQSQRPALPVPVSARPHGQRATSAPSAGEAIPLGPGSRPLLGPAQPGTSSLAAVPASSTGRSTGPIDPSQPPVNGGGPPSILPPPRSFASPGGGQSGAHAGPTRKAGPSQFWDRARNVIAKQGPAGQDLAERLHQWREIAERAAGQWVNDMPMTRALSKKEFVNFVDVAEGNAQPINQRVVGAVNEWKRVREQIYNVANQLGVIVGRQEHYFPHMYDPKLFEGDSFIKMRDHLIKTGQAQTPEQAARMLRNVSDTIRARRFGNLEVAREVDLPGYEKTRDALMSYIESSADRLAQVYLFGQADEQAMALISRIADEGGDASAVKNLFDIAVGAKKYGAYQERIARALRAFNVLTKMGLGAITNLSQSLNTATVVGPIRTITNAPRAMFDRETKDFALQIGVTLDGVLTNLREAGGWEGKLGRDIGAPGFNTVERFNRTLAAVAGRDYARMLAGKARQGEQWAVEALNMMRLDGQDIARRGTLTRDEEATAARNIVERTQFKVDPQDLPGWVSSPWGKLVAQFRTFGYNQTAFMAREVIRPAMKGNVKPLLTFLIFGLPVGASMVEVQNFLRNRPSEEDPVQMIRQWYQRVGVIGLLGDVLAGIAPPNTKYLPGERYALQVAGTAFGPSMGTFLEGAGSVATALQGKPEGIERWALKQIPVVGPTLKNTLLPYRPGGRAGTRPVSAQPGPVKALPNVGPPKFVYPGRR